MSEAGGIEGAIKRTNRLVHVGVGKATWTPPATGIKGNAACGSLDDDH